MTELSPSHPDFSRPDLPQRDFFYDVPGAPGGGTERLAVTHVVPRTPYVPRRPDTPRPAPAAEAAPAAPTAVLLHGAGGGSKERLRPLLAEFAAQGCGALALDFSGHGESSGALPELSLRRRYEQAVAVIDGQVAADTPLVLVGFSMSGQTAADLARHYGDRVAALALCAPAVYPAEAWDLPFGAGDGRFSQLIRTPDRWRDSPALDALRAFAGRAVLVVPGTDEIIPAAVTEAVQDALTARARYTRVALPDADHFLGLWFHDSADSRRDLVTTLLDGNGNGNGNGDSDGDGDGGRTAARGR
ncbi:alpha/beta hydrolase [Streptomyces sp. NPDC088789]|uniref:alpha/beta hydrolase n=1 Tax=Streptomyces sp. NPDC088789 TaxID=3365899 RepID=UPI0037FBF421